MCFCKLPTQKHFVFRIVTRDRTTGCGVWLRQVVWKLPSVSWKMIIQAVLVSCCSTTTPHIQCYPISVTITSSQAGRRTTDCSFELFFCCSYVAHVRSKSWGGFKPFIWYRGSHRKGLKCWRFVSFCYFSARQEEHKTQNGLNCYSSSMALQTIAINQFRWTDMLVLLGYLMYSEGCIYPDPCHSEIRLAFLSLTHAKHWRPVALL